MNSAGPRGSRGSADYPPIAQRTALCSRAPLPGLRRGPRPIETLRYE